MAQLNEVGQLLGNDGTETDPRELSLLFAQILCAAPWQGEIAQYELYLDASRRGSDDREAVLEILAAFEDVAVQALKSIGCPHPEQIAPIFVAMADGYGLRRIGMGHDLDPAPLADAFYRLFLSYTDRPGRLHRQLTLGARVRGVRSVGRYAWVPRRRATPSHSSTVDAIVS